MSPHCYPILRSHYKHIYYYLHWFMVNIITFNHYYSHCLLGYTIGYTPLYTGWYCLRNSFLFFLICFVFQSGAAFPCYLLHLASLGFTLASLGFWRLASGFWLWLHLALGFCLLSQRQKPKSQKTKAKGQVKPEPKARGQTPKAK